MTVQEISIEFEFPVDIYPSTDTITRSFEATKVIVGRLPDFMRALFPDEPDLHPVTMKLVSIEHREGSFIKDIKILVEFPKKFAESIDRLSKTVGDIGEEWNSKKIKRFKKTISASFCVLVIIGGCVITAQTLDIADRAVNPSKSSTQKPTQKETTIDKDGVQYRYKIDPKHQEYWDLASKDDFAKVPTSFKKSQNLKASEESARAVLLWFVRPEMVNDVFFLARNWIVSDADRDQLIDTCVDFLAPSLSVASGPALLVDGREVVSATSLRHLVGREVRPAGTPPRP